MVLEIEDSDRAMTRRRMLVGAGLAGMAALGMSALGAEIDEALVAAAKKEGRGTLYSVVEPTVTRKTIAAFTAKYGIEIEVDRLIAGPLLQRLSAEEESGNMVADVIISTDKSMVQMAIGRNWFAPVADIPNRVAIPARYQDRFWINIGHIPYSLVWNTNEFKEAPTGWRSLLDPKYKGRLLLIEPRIGAGPAQWYMLMQQTYGDEFLRRLGLSAQFVASVVPGLQQVAAGAKGIYAPAVHLVTDSLLAKGAPIAEIFPEPTVATENYMSIIAKAPHPNVARLLAGYFLSAEGQGLLNPNGWPTRPNVPGSRPLPKLVEIDSIAALGKAKEYAKLLGLG
jgi:iron(III) transport system substrate-binding protein